MKSIITIASIAALAGSASANLVVSEFLFSTTGGDSEYVELYNDGFGGNTSVDISGWTFERWESDNAEGDFGTQTFGVTVDAGTVLGVGDVWTLGNSNASSEYGSGLFNQSFSDSMENGSGTFVWRDSGGVAQSVLYTEDPDTDGATPIFTPDVTFGPDGPFLASGYYRTDAAGSFTTTDFFNGSPNNPGAQNYAPVPTPGALALLGLGGLTAARRRRA